MTNFDKYFDQLFKEATHREENVKVERQRDTRIELSVHGTNTGRTELREITRIRTGRLTDNVEQTKPNA